MATADRVAPEETEAEKTQPIQVHESWLPDGHPLYRPRHSSRQRTALVSAAVFFLVPILAFVFGAHPPAFENRPLATFPSLTDGWGLFTGMSAWATDHLAFRQAGVLAEDEISRRVFGELAPRSQTDSGTPIGPVPGDSSGAGRGDRQLRAEDFPPVIQGRDGWLYLGQDVSYKCLPERGLDEVIASLRELRSVVERSGRDFELVIPPDKSTMVPEHLPASYAGQRCRQELTERFWPRVISAAGAIDLRPALRAGSARIGRPLYDPNDTHWTYDGGLVMTYALAQRLHAGITASWMVRKTDHEPWPADIPPLLGRSVQRSLQAYSLAPDGHTNLAHYVASDFRSPLRLDSPGNRGVRGVVDSPVGMIADSFSQFASPFLAAAFSDITIVHPETVAADPTRYAREVLADKKVVVLELAERNAAGGQSPLLRPDVIEAIGRVLFHHRVK
ncbi:MAG: alginate O-acetyltransferase AlgX-related protein [Sciscionella sp.]